MRPEVRRRIEAFLDCGCLKNGFARLRCSTCHAELLLAHSCQIRNFCPSCQAKRSAVVAEKIAQVVAPVRHRHMTLTIPKAIRRLFERDRELLSLLSRTAYDAIRGTFAALLERDDVVPGVAASIQTFGSFGCNYHPHWHALVTQGAFTRDGAFLPLPDVKTELIEEAFRRLLLERLHRAERLSEEFRDQLLTWVHSGFSVHAAQVVDGADAEQVERVGRYMTRAPLRIDAIRLEADGRVVVETPPDPATGATERRFDPLDWIQEVVTQTCAP